MSKRRKPDPNALRPGDYLHLTVPDNRHLSTGTYRARIESLAPKGNGKRYAAQSYNCAIVVNELDFDDEAALTIHFRLTVYDTPCLDRNTCFLGKDTFPVTFKPELNLERRLAASLPPKERLPYADS